MQEQKLIEAETFKRIYGNEIRNIILNDQILQRIREQERWNQFKELCQDLRLKTAAGDYP